ncbi:MAG: polyphenol oxidase family protein [Pseudobdellovibrionaceae bacterium]|nr:polyphenol oxidase family protein [Pseudobdellovibrionaceae bacterium]
MQKYHIHGYHIIFGNRFFNLDTFLSLLPTHQVRQIQQVHSNRIFWTQDVPTEITDSVTQGDGLLSRSANDVLVIRTADCLPIAVYCLGEEPFFGILHAGWRGIAAGIIQECIRLIGTKRANSIYLHIGPHILWDSYEVSRDVVEAVTHSLSIQQKEQCIRWINKEKAMLSLQNVVIGQAEALGIPRQNIIGSEIDTFQNDSFYSYRRNKTNQRNISLIFYQKPETDLMAFN